MSNVAEENQVKSEEIEVTQIEVNQIEVEQVQTDSTQVEEVQIEEEPVEKKSEKEIAAEKLEIRKYYQNIVKELSERFPNAIKEKSKDVKPLKIGILEDVMKKTDRRYSVPLLRRIFGYYCSSFAYLKATIKETHRINLDGDPVQEISETHKNIARKKLEIIRNPESVANGKAASELAKKAAKAEAHILRQKAEMEAAVIRRAEKAAKKREEQAAAKAAKAATKAEQTASAPEVPKADSTPKQTKPKKEDSKPVTVVVKTKKTETTAPTVIIKKKPEITMETPTPVTATVATGEGEPVRKKLSLKSKA